MIGPAEDEYEPVEGIDADTIACQRACEAVAAAKTASDYQHVVWAYGVLWSLFAIYGLLLWWRAGKQKVEIADLDRRLRALEDK
jgi:hypothetical protein